MRIWDENHFVQGDIKNKDDQGLTEITLIFDITTVETVFQPTEQLILKRRRVVKKRTR